MSLRPRTFIIIIVVFLFLIGGGVLGFMALNNIGPFASGDETAIIGDNGDIPAEPTATPTPTIRFVEVVVAQKRILVGQKITQGMVTIKMRPDTNIAVQAGVTYQTIEEVIGNVAKTEIAPGQEVIRPMIALSPTDLAAFGSDLSLYVDRGEVAVAFPITTLSGVGYAMRPGDFIDVLMSVNMLQLDPEFETALPNAVASINQETFERDNFLAFTMLHAQGRFEVIPVLNAVQEIVPRFSLERAQEINGAGMDLQIPRQITQLTIQQAKVIWVGTWNDPRLELPDDLEITFNLGAAGGASEDGQAAVADETPVPTVAPAEDDEGLVVATAAPKPTKERPEDSPDLLILSMTPQEAMLLKWALESGIDIDFVLRSQGDFQTFFTTSVSLPQMIEQGGLTIPEYYEQDGTVWDLEQRIEEVPTPGVPRARPTQN